MDIETHMRSLTNAIVFTGMLCLCLLGCQKVSELNYDTKADRPTLAQLKGKRVAILPIQYNPKAIGSGGNVSEDARQAIIQNQKAAIKSRFQGLFQIVEVGEMSQPVKEILITHSADAAFVVNSSYAFSMNSGRTDVEFYYLASKVELVDREGKIVWTFYGKAAALPKAFEGLEPGEFIRGIFAVDPSAERVTKALSAITDHYTDYVRWAIEADMQGESGKNYFVDFPPSSRNEEMAIYPASETWHVPIIVDATTK